MSWIRLDDGWDEHPKVLAVSEPAVLMWLRAIAYSNRRKTNGFVPVAVLHRLTPHKHPLKLANELADVRVPGCRGGLFDRVDTGGFSVHDHGEYQPSTVGESPNRRPSAELHEKRAAAGRLGAVTRWSRPTARDGIVPSASETDDRCGDGTLPLASMASLPPPVPVPAPVYTPAQAGERVHASLVDRRGLATAEVWLAAVRKYPALTLLHEDHGWAHELEGTAASRGTRAEDAEAAVAAFVDKNAGKLWPHREDLVRAFGGFSAKAKEFGDQARTHAARETASSRSAGIGNPRGRTTVNGHRGPQPTPAGAIGLDLDDGSHDRRPTP